MSRTEQTPGQQPGQDGSEGAHETDKDRRQRGQPAVGAVQQQRHRHGRQGMGGEHQQGAVSVTVSRHARHRTVVVAVIGLHAVEQDLAGQGRADGPGQAANPPGPGQDGKEEAGRGERQRPVRHRRLGSEVVPHRGQDGAHYREDARAPTPRRHLSLRGRRGAGYETASACHAAPIIHVFGPPDAGQGRYTRRWGESRTHDRCGIL
ncbi:hypothetical protein [Actinacidiphila oryziradicis]|uniref:Uncharacterized protein n=1 Tax=Actinacidiphila oryziradicis TaxID=2571141 RepID=A0A4U0RWC9_9ACTN|nr:hypothetical protein [Actinacidiphila oryziradicis]TKA00596.1 hypothetical protein FCI23_42475 [Actinacidiphila oryziradicis]